MTVCFLVGDYAHSEDGIGRYKTNLLHGIKNLDKQINIRLIPNTKTVPRSLNKKKSLASRIPPNIKDKIIKLIYPIEMEINYFNRFQRDRNAYLSELAGVKADVYHAISPSEALAGVKLNKRPLVTTFHDIIPLVSENRFVFEKFYFKHYVKAASKSDIILADSKKTKADLESILNIPSEKIIVIYPGIDMSKFYTAKKILKLNKTILYHGGLVRRKGIYETLYAFNLLLKKRKDIRLLISGGGEEEKKLKSEVIKLKLSDFVTFLGFVPDEDIVKTYHSADLFVYPSKYEGFGYTPLEAMACGIPVIASNTSSIPEVVGNAGLAINPYDIKNICMEINNVLNSPDLQSTMIAKGLIQVKNFSKEKSALQVIDVYKSLA